MSEDLAGCTALVTGASRNIGRAIALALAADGADIAVHVASDLAAGEDTAAGVRALGRRAVLLSGDLGDPADAARVVSEAVAALGGLDVLVNNAAIRPEASFTEIRYEDWRRVMAVCLDSVFLVSQAAVPALRRSTRAAIVNLGGMTGHIGALHRAHVVAAKAGVVGLTKAMAHDLSPEGITVNCVVPGLIETERLAAAGGKPAKHHAGRTNLLGHRGAPEDVAGAVAYLSGAGARYITGASLHVNGGAYLP